MPDSPATILQLLGDVHFAAKNIQWFFLLLASLTLSFWGVVIPNRYKQGLEPRSHNGLKLLNECLGRHQFVYPTYFFTLAIAGDFDPQISWIKYLLGFLLFLAFGFYIDGVYRSANQDKDIADHHFCENTRCGIGVSGRIRAKLLAPSFLEALGLFVAAIWLTLLIK